MSYDLVIVGAGQAGLVAGYYARRAKLNFIILDSSPRIGDGWRKRYDSLQLFSTRRLSSLPGFKFPGNPHGYPTKDEAGDYLESYANHWRLPVRLNTSVKSITKVDDYFGIETGTGKFLARAIIAATGGFQAPRIPNLPGRPSKRLVQVHSVDYRNPALVPPGRVLVVGGGNSGAAIASELSLTHEVELSSKSPLKFHNRRGWHKTIPYLARALGLVYAPHTSALGRRIQRYGIPIIGSPLKTLLSQDKIRLRPQTVSLNANTVTFSDGQTQTYNSIIWCTGFKPSLSLIRIPPALDDSGAPLHHFGVSPVPGLFYLGLHWQRSLASALMGGVAKDARFIIQNVNHYLAMQPTLPSS